MKKVLLLSRQPLSRRPLHEWLGEAARHVVLVTSPSAVAGFADRLDELFLGHVLVDDYHSWAAERAAEAAAREYAVDLIASTSESDVIRAARLRERLGLRGQSVASAVAYRDKVVMKDLCAAAGLTVPRYAAVDGPLDLLDFLDEHGYPAVVKPRFGAGAEDVRILREPADVTGFLAGQPRSGTTHLPGQWMAESFVTGDFFHVDGVMRGGRVVHCWPGLYNGGVAERVRDELNLSSVLVGSREPRRTLLTGFARDVVAALPATDLPCAFHLEVWLDKAGQPVLCEIASRAGGGPIAELYERCFGVQLAREGLRAQCGLPLTLTRQPAEPSAPSGWILFAPGHGVFEPPPGPCPVPGVTLSVTLTAGTRSAGVAGAVDAAAKALVIADSAGGVQERVDDANRWWRASTRWR